MGTTRYADGPTARAHVQVGAPPERVWALVSDIHLIAALSREVQEVEWLSGAGAVGSTFRGRSRHPAVGEWTTVPHVVECASPRVFAWAVQDPECPAALWRFELRPVDAGTELRQSVRMGPGRSNVSMMIDSMPGEEERIVAGRLAEFQAAVEANLAAIAQRAAAGDVRPVGR